MTHSLEWEAFQVRTEDLLRVQQGFQTGSDTVILMFFVSLCFLLMFLFFNAMFWILLNEILINCVLCCVTVV